MSFTLVAEDASGSQSITLTDVPTTFGREDCDFIYEISKVSSKHCELQVTELQVWVTDMSTDGTYLDGRQIGKGERVIMTIGQTLTLLDPASQASEDGAPLFRLQPLDPPISIRARVITVGKFNCGACDLIFDGVTFRWIFDYECARGPSTSRTAGTFEIKASAIEFVEVNKTDGILGIWGPFCGGIYNEPEIRVEYAPFATRGDPKNGIRIHYRKEDYAHAGWPSDIGKLCPKFSHPNSRLISFVPHHTTLNLQDLQPPQRSTQLPTPSSSHHAQPRGRGDSGRAIKNAPGRGCFRCAGSDFAPYKRAARFALFELPDDLLATSLCNLGIRSKIFLLSTSLAVRHRMQNLPSLWHELSLGESWDSTVRRFGHPATFRERVDINDSSLSALLQHVNAHAHTVTLSLRHCWKLTGIGLTPLKHSTTLRTLDLRTAIDLYLDDAPMKILDLKVVHSVVKTMLPKSEAEYNGQLRSVVLNRNNQLADPTKPWAGFDHFGVKIWKMCSNAQKLRIVRENAICSAISCQSCTNSQGGTCTGCGLQSCCPFKRTDRSMPRSCPRMKVCAGCSRVMCKTCINPASNSKCLLVQNFEKNYKCSHCKNSFCADCRGQALTKCAEYALHGFEPALLWMHL